MNPVVPEGLKVEFHHRRLSVMAWCLSYDEEPQERKKKVLYYSKEGWELDPDQISPQGGATVCDIFDAEGNPLAVGVAVCSPKDNFNKKIGRHIALGRALKCLREETA